MPGIVEMRVIPLKLIKVQTVRAQILNALKQSGKEMIFMLEQTVATWNHKVTFDSQVFYKGGNLRVQVWTQDYAWNVLDRGTSVRFATMTPDFMPKTYPKVFGSVAGQGGKAFVNKNRPRPGIKKREWSTTLKRGYAPRFQELIGLAIFKGMKG